MKKINFYFLGLLLLFFPSFAYSQWEKVGVLDKIQASDTTILEYVLSPDGKSIYVLDYNYNLKKIRC